jgi:transcriptional regulator with XRE-family HTH domain
MPSRITGKHSEDTPSRHASSPSGLGPRYTAATELSRRPQTVHRGRPGRCLRATLSDVDASLWPVDSPRTLSIAVRSGGRRLGLSQRAVAAKAGVNQSSVARLEAEHEVTTRVATAVLSAVGLRLVVVGPEVEERPEDSARDTGGHRLPAHLRARATRRLPLYTWLRRYYRGGPVLLGRRGEFRVYERPRPQPGQEITRDGR